MHQIDRLGGLEALTGGETPAVMGMPLGELVDWVKSDANQQKGEMALLIHGYRDSAEDGLPEEALRALTVLLKELPVKRAAAMVAEIYNVKKNALYKWGLENLNQ